MITHYSTREPQTSPFRVSNLIIIVALLLMRRPILGIAKGGIRLAAVLVRPALFVFGIAKALGLVRKQGTGSKSLSNIVPEPIG